MAEAKISEKLTFFFVALSEFDKNLHPIDISNETYLCVLQRMIEFCNLRSQKFPVLLPLIGSGASGVNINECEAADLILQMIKLNRTKINSDLHVIIKDNAKNTVSIIRRV